MEEAADYRAGDGLELSGAAVVIPDDCVGLRFDAALARMFPAHSRSRLQDWIKSGRFLLDGAAMEAKRKVLGGEMLSWVPGANPGGKAAPDDLDELAVPPAPTCAQAQSIALTIVFEDAHIVVINKPAGLVVHPGNGNPDGTLMNGLLHHHPALADVPRAGIVHRLDKETSGLLVVAKTLIAQTDLVRQLQARTVKRHYLALALGSVAYGGCVDAPIGRHPVHRTRMAVVRGAHGREARTRYEVMERFARATLLECQLETGRTHQIRVHLASIGHPLAGDPVYGKTSSGDARLDAFSRQALHAWRLALVHPATGDLVTWEAPLPEDFSQLLDTLRRD